MATSRPPAAAHAEIIRFPQAAVAGAPVAARTAASTLDCLTVLRFFAALAIVLYHIRPVLTNFFTESHAAELAPFAHLAIGVQFFFVLSGFILFYNYGTRERLDLREFYVKRLARIYPLHLATFGLWCWLCLPLWAGVSFRAALASGVANFFLLHAFLPGPLFNLGYNAVTWSLSNEAFFYAAFPWLRRPGAAAVVFAASAAGLVAIHFSGLHASLSARFPNFEYFFPPARILDFCAGILAARMFSAGARLRHATFFELAALAMAALQALAVVAPPSLRGPVCAPVFAWTIWVFAHQQGAISRFLARRRALVLLGEASFSLYMGHHMLMVQCNMRLPHGMHRWSAAGLSIALALALSIASFKLFEDPARRGLTRLLLGQSRARAKPEASVPPASYRRAA